MRLREAYWSLSMSSLNWKMKMRNITYGHSRIILIFKWKRKYRAWRKLSFFNLYFVIVFGINIKILRNEEGICCEWTRQSKKYVFTVFRLIFSVFMWKCLLYKIPLRARERSKGDTGVRPFPRIPLASIHLGWAMRAPPGKTLVGMIGQRPPGNWSRHHKTRDWEPHRAALLGSLPSCSPPGRPSQ